MPGINKNKCPNRTSNILSPKTGKQAVNSLPLLLYHTQQCVMLFAWSMPAHMSVHMCVMCFGLWWAQRRQLGDKKHIGAQHLPASLLKDWIRKPMACGVPLIVTSKFPQTITRCSAQRLHSAREGTSIKINHIKQPEVESEFPLFVALTSTWSVLWKDEKLKRWE